MTPPDTLPDSPPDAQRIMAAIDATWPPAEFYRAGSWLLRRGAGGGQRVSAASIAESGDQAAGIAPAEDTMRAWGQRPLFRLTPDQAQLDRRLAAAGYAMKDPVALYAAPAAALAGGHDETAKVFRTASPLAIADEIWARGGIGPGRRAVMTRVQGPCMILLARAGDRPAGVAFVAVANKEGDGDIAMIHAIEVAPEHRRKGGGLLLMRGAASFAAEQGAAWLALAVTEANAPARALYARLGIARVGSYHYRIASSCREDAP